jgi:hypothetical protein
MADGVGFGYTIRIVHREDTTFEILSNQCTNTPAPVRTVSVRPQSQVKAVEQKFN